MADITVLNLNMLYIRFFDRIEREPHIPLGPLYLTRAIEDAGYSVDFRDYQFHEDEEIFLPETIADYLEGSAEAVGLSVMANLLPLAIQAAQAVKERHPEKTIILGGVGPKGVEKEILTRYPFIDAIAYGEFEKAAPSLMKCLIHGAPFSECPSLYFRGSTGVVKTGPAARITNLGTLPYPAYEKTDLLRYRGLGMMTSRGCPYQCSFCSVAPIWDYHAELRSAESIIAEMAYLARMSGRNLFLFQDEYFLASPDRAKDFSRKLIASGLTVRWKAFGRINLMDREAMELMAEAGCVQIRFGIESGSDEILQQVVKGFSVDQAIDVVSDSLEVFPSVDTFFIWGYPFETMDQFYQSLGLMNSFRAMGARILPSLLCYLPQTRIYQEIDRSQLEFSPETLPEYMVTGCEYIGGCRCSLDDRYADLYNLIRSNPDIFPGFFHFNLADNIRPKLEALTEFGFYGSGLDSEESCGGQSPNLASATGLSPS